MTATKADIRRDIKHRKQLLTEQEKADAAHRCFALLEQCREFTDARNVLVYASLPDEISTAGFIDRWHNEKRLFLPRVNGDDLDILPYSPADTGKGAFGIEEPMGSDCHDIEEIDLVVVPGVAFDRKGNRLGRGRGYYDRLLSQARCPLIGVAYSLQIAEELPAEPHDIKIPVVITEKEIIRTL